MFSVALVAWSKFPFQSFFLQDEDLGVRRGGHTQVVFCRFCDFWLECCRCVRRNGAIRRTCCGCDCSVLQDVLQLRGFQIDCGTQSWCSATCGFLLNAYVRGICDACFWGMCGMVVWEMSRIVAQWCVSGLFFVLGGVALLGICFVCSVLSQRVAAALGYLSMCNDFLRT